MDLLAQIISGVGLQEAIAITGLIAFWARLEHRITKLETKIEGLPCPGRKSHK